MKKILSCILLCAMVLSVFTVEIFAEETAITPDTSWYEDGKDEFTLENKDQLAGFNKLITSGNSFGDKTVYLGADIDMKGYDWDSTGIFQGTFDGQGHSISNLTPVVTGGKKYGMFCYAAGTIRNFYLIEPNVGSAGTSHVGAVVGSRRDSALKDQSLTIENVHVVNGTVVGYGYVGGIIGNADDSDAPAGDAVTIINCSFSGSVSGTNSGRVGGLVGNAERANGLYIKNCSFSGTVSNQATYSGGIIGYTATNTTLENCDVSSGSGSISATAVNYNVYVGGLIGRINASAAETTVNINACHVNATMTVSGNFAGGLIGHANFGSHASKLSIRNCVAEGEMKISGGASQSGIVGRLGASNAQTEICFENVIAAMSGTGSNNYRAFVRADGITAVLKMINVYCGTEQASKGLYLPTDLQISSDQTQYGAKSIEELQALKFTGWTTRPDQYPLPSSLIYQTFLAGYQAKTVNSDSTTDYRFVAVLKLEDGKTLADCSDVGFMVTLTDDTTGTKLYDNEKISGKAVYTEIIGTGDDGNIIRYKPNQFSGDYLFAMVLEGVEPDAAFTVKLTPYTTDADGNDVLGTEAELTEKN